MSDEGEYDTGEDCLEDSDQADCDYGLTEFCIDPFLRSIGNCFECALYLNSCEAEDKEREKEVQANKEVENGMSGVLGKEQNQQVRLELALDEWELNRKKKCVEGHC